MRAVFALTLVAVMILASQAGASTGVRYKDEVFKRVDVEKDVEYGFGPATAHDDGGPLLLDLYRPHRDEVERRPAIVWVHGGGFMVGDKRDKLTRTLAKVFARKGYVTVSIDYRLLARTPCGGSPSFSPECFEAAVEGGHDAQAAIRYLRANAKAYGVDKRRIAIGGASAGAIISCGVAALAAEPGTSGNPGPSSAVQGFVSISGGMPGGAFVDARTAPGILFASTRDPIAPYAWSTEMATAMQSFGVPVRLTSFDSAVHVPFLQFRDRIYRQITKSLYANLDLDDANAGR